MGSFAFPVDLSSNAPKLLTTTLPGDALMSELRRSPALLEKCLRTIAQRLRHMSGRHRDDSLPVHELAAAERQPHELLAHLHRHLLRHGPAHVFMTMTLLMLDLDSNAAAFAVAGPF